MIEEGHAIEILRQ